MSIDVFIESGKKKVFAGAIDWAGWARSGRDEDQALSNLVAYGSRYGDVLRNGGVDFKPPSQVSELKIIERHVGNTTTDFGAPAIFLEADRRPVQSWEYVRFNEVISTAWQAFDAALIKAQGKELRKGPRGGGRDQERIINHVIDGDRSYLARLAWSHKRDKTLSLSEELQSTRQAITGALEIAARGELPERGPRGGVIWPPRFFVRRVVWHTLDHAWEIEDRL